MFKTNEKFIKLYVGLKAYWFVDQGLWIYGLCRDLWTIASWVWILALALGLKLLGRLGIKKKHLDKSVH